MTRIGAGVASRARSLRRRDRRAGRTGCVVSTASIPTTIRPWWIRNISATACFGNTNIPPQPAVNRHVPVSGGIDTLTHRLPDNGNDTGLPIAPIGRYSRLGAKFR